MDINYSDVNILNQNSKDVCSIVKTLNPENLNYVE